MFIHEMEQQGVWFFRYRSFVPLLLLPLAVLVLAGRHRYWADSSNLEFLYELGCLVVSLCGILVRAISQGYAQAGSSGRNTREQIADHLNTRGVYSVVRHPLYLGNMLIMLGILLFTRSLLLSLAGMLFYFLFYERIIIVEERFLSEKFGPAFQEWASQTPAWLPRFSLWKRPGIRFSFRAAVKGEFYGVTALAAVMLVLHILKNWFIEKQLKPNVFWLSFFVVSVCAFLILRIIRKRTRFFEVSERAENGT